MTKRIAVQIEDSEKVCDILIENDICFEEYYDDEKPHKKSFFLIKEDLLVFNDFCKELEEQGIKIISKELNV